MNPATTTDAQGRAKLRCFAGAGGERNLLYERGSASARGFRVKCSMPGYVTQEVPIVESLKFGRVLFVPWGSRTVHASIRIAPESTTQPTTHIATN